MSIIKTNKVIAAVIVFIAVCLSAYITIPVLADEPALKVPSIEKFLSGEAFPEEAYILIDKFQSEIKKNPLNNANYAALAFFYDYIGAYDKALEAIKSEIKYTPEKSEWDIIYGNFAREYLNLDRLGDVSKPALKSLKFNFRNITSRMLLLKYYILKGRYKEAGLELKILSRLDKETDFYYEIYAYCFDKIKNGNDIIELFKEFVKANPKSYLAYRILGTAIRDFSYGDMERNLPMIMESFNKALELNPTYIPIYISISNTYMHLGLKTNNKSYFNESLNQINKAYKLDQKNLKLAYCAGYIFLAMDEYDKGIERLEHVFNRGFNDQDTAELLAAAYNNKAYSYYETGKNIKEGLKIIERAIMLDPNNGLILSTKAELLYKSKRFKEAYKYIQMAMKLKPDEPGIKQDLANIEKAMKGK
ncbi:MAG: hypothetical protein NTV71_00510 [Candidatus Omnitrophica bacterium]|nr:hypothetical protein [Candidatus Omnitrophota bacterium]